MLSHSYQTHLPGEAKILLKVLHCGIWETDSFVYRTGQFAVLGMILSHMGGGEIQEIGPDIVGWKIGDRVAVDPRVYCGECLACRGGHSTMCQERLESQLGVWIGINAYRDERREQLYHGMLAEYFVVPEYSCYPIPYSISNEMSVAVEGTAYSVRCIRKAECDSATIPYYLAPQIIVSSGYSGQSMSGLDESLSSSPSKSGGRWLGS